MNFLESNWSVIFYNILCIIIGIIVLVFAIVRLVKEKKRLFPIVCMVHSALFLFFGVFGFFVPEKYGVLSVLAMLAFTITLIICFLTIGKKEKK